MNIFNSYNKYILELEQINKAAKNDPKGFIDEVEFSYKSTIKRISREIKELKNKCKVIMLSGPSSSGKTTTANMLINELKSLGFGAIMISLDDFFKGAGKAPLLPSGEYDYEDVRALNISQLKECLLNLINQGYCEKPIFDFVNRRPSDCKELIKVKKGDIAIVEGLHALNPLITDNLPGEDILKIYVSVEQGIINGSESILSPKEIRFLRRLVRDYRFRGSLPHETAAMWKSVCDGEIKYIKPYKNTSNITINSLHIYEPCIMYKDAIPLLETFTEENNLYSYICHIKKVLSNFVPIDDLLMPKDSMMREFIGGGIY